MMERHFSDLGDVGTGTTALTRDDDAHWSAILRLACGQSFSWNGGVRIDFIVLEGSVRNEVGSLLNAGDFISRCDAGSLTADDAPVLLFAYRERRTQDCLNIHVPVAAREWRAARVPNMDVATLSDAGHRVSLVRWRPGACVQPHAHRDGEEILVLEGELRSGDEAYPRGTWLRLHAQATHAPFAEVPALIILRNGHLRSGSSRSR